MRFTTQLGHNLFAALLNPHIRYPVLIAAALEIAGVWLPSWKTQFNDTEKILMAYGIIAAANTGPRPVRKDPLPPPPPQNPPTLFH